MNINHFLLEKAKKFNHPDFITNDPISLPHQFTKKQDIEIIGFWVAMLSWGNRKSIINSGKKLIELMDGAPHDFIVNHKEIERKRFLSFKHRTFQSTDSLYFLEFLQSHYRNHQSLEEAFSRHKKENDKDLSHILSGFHHYFFALPDAPDRTRKHIATPQRGSCCKRLCMFLRWMVRKDEQGVDFGIWRSIEASILNIPLDVHVERIARKLGLLKRKQRDWKAVIELTEELKKVHPQDPVLLDYALFGLGVIEKDPF